MAKEIFGAELSIKDNVSSVLKQARESSRGFRGEVERAKSELAKLDKQKVKEKELRLKNTQAYKAIEEIKKKAKPLEKIAVNMVAKTEKAIGSIKDVKRHLDRIKENKVIKFAQEGAEKVTKAIGKTAVVGATVALTAMAAAGTAAVVQAVDFQAAMQNVGTLLDGDVNGKLQTMGVDLKRVSLDTGVATADLSDGLYQVVSAFGESADSVKQLEVAAKSAKAGNATTSDSVNLLSAVTKGYGDTSAAAVQKAADLAFQTAKLGQTTFPELASSMGAVIPLASTLKVNQETLFGAMATLTGVTGNTAEVTTQLKATMQSFLSPSKEMEKSLKKMGYSSGAAALESEDLGSVLEKLKESVNGDEVAFANMFASVEAKNAVLALTGSQADAFKEKTAAMGEAAGSSQKAFETQTASVKEMADKVKNAGKVMLTSLGEKVLPYITSALEKVIDKLPAMEETFDQVASAVGPIIETIGSYLTDLYNDWKPTIEQIKTDFTDAAESCAPFFETIMTNFSTMLPYIKPIVKTLSKVITSILPPIASTFADISGVVAEVFPIVAEIIQGVGSKITEIFEAITSETGGLSEIFEAAGPAISAVLTTMWTVAEPLLDLAVSGVEILSEAIGAAFPYIQEVIETVWEVIEPIISGIGEGISAVASVVDQIQGEAPKNSTHSGGGRNFDNNTASTSQYSSGGRNFDNNATGTSFYSGGWTEVGEHGPELMKLPSGTQIKSNSASQNLSQGGNSYNINIEKMEVRKENDIDKIAAEIVKKIEEAGDNS